MYKGKRKMKRINLQDVKLTQTRCQNLYVSTMSACRRSIVVMVGVSWRGGSQKLTKLASTTQFKMEDVCILCNVIDIFEPPHPPHGQGL
jgi:hypothetical protein